MNINIRDILELSDNNRYIVVSKVFYDGKDYLYLVDVNDNDNLKFCYLDKDEIVEISDKDINTRLLPLFLDKVKETISAE